MHVDGWTCPIALSMCKSRIGKNGGVTNGKYRYEIKGCRQLRDFASWLPLAAGAGASSRNLVLAFFLMSVNINITWDQTGCPESLQANSGRIFNAFIFSV